MGSPAYILDVELPIGHVSIATRDVTIPDTSVAEEWPTPTDPTGEDDDTSDAPDTPLIGTAIGAGSASGTVAVRAAIQGVSTGVGSASGLLGRYVELEGIATGDGSATASLAMTQSATATCVVTSVGYATGVAAHGSVNAVGSTSALLCIVGHAAVTTTGTALPGRMARGNIAATATVTHPTIIARAAGTTTSTNSHATAPSAGSHDAYGTVTATGNVATKQIRIRGTGVVVFSCRAARTVFPKYQGFSTAIGVAAPTKCVPASGIVQTTALLYPPKAGSGAVTSTGDITGALVREGPYCQANTLSTGTTAAMLLATASGGTNRTFPAYNEGTYGSGNYGGWSIPTARPNFIFKKNAVGLPSISGATTARLLATAAGAATAIGAGVAFPVFGDMVVTATGTAAATLSTPATGGMILSSHAYNMGSYDEGKYGGNPQLAAVPTIF